MADEIQILPLDDPEGSARWIKGRGSAALWDELDRTIQFFGQACCFIGERRDGWEGAAEDREHAHRLIGQLTTELKARMTNDCGEYVRTR